MKKNQQERQNRPQVMYTVNPAERFILFFLKIAFYAFLALVAFVLLCIVIAYFKEGSASANKIIVDMLNLIVGARQ